MTIESVGPYLKQTREAQGLSLDQVASLTRIQMRFLQAIEDEEFADLPEQVFTRGFVRTYARSLGINEEDVLLRFSEASSEFYERGKQEFQQGQLKLEEERRGKWNRNVVIGITAVVLIGLAIFLPKQQTHPPTSSEETALPSPSSSLPKTEETESASPGETLNQPNTDLQEPTVSAVPATAPATPQQDEKPADVEKTTSDVAPSTEGPMVLELEATQLTWVVVKSDDQEPHEALLQPGQRATWKADSQFTLTLGNAAGVVVRLNGESRGPFGKPGEVVREVVIRN